MAAYGQNSTSPGSFSVEIGDVGHTNVFSQTNTADRHYEPSHHDEFQFMQSSSVNGIELALFLF